MKDMPLKVDGQGCALMQVGVSRVVVKQSVGTRLLYCQELIRSAAKGRREMNQKVVTLIGTPSI